MSRGVEQNVWHGYLGKYDWGDADEQFHISPSEILDRARRRVLTEQVNSIGIRGNRVTDFTKWIGALYRQAPSGNMLIEGKDIEQQILQLIKKFAYQRIPSDRLWKCIHSTSLDDSESVFQISRLSINTLPLRGVPDVVFRNLQTGEILIVEIKVTDKPIPFDGWPDLRAQLWCYAQIDDWLQAPKIHLAAEIWSKCPSHGLPSRRKILHWDNSNESFCLENKLLFELYSGAAKINNPFLK